MQKKKFDEFEDDKVYKQIFLWSSGLMMFLLTIYFVFLNCGFDFLNMDFIENEALQIVANVLIQFFGTVGINVCIYGLVYKIFEYKWKKNNKDIYIRGEWLTIHNKENIRIGIVNIHQSFKTIKAEAYNISPKVEGIKQKPKSNWEYSCVSLSPEQLVGVRLLGCYVSKKDSEDIMGVHQINSIEINENVDKFPYKMSGKFFDTVKNNGKKVININDNIGEIYFYKMTPQIKEYLKKGEKEEQLKNILNETTLQDEFFVKKLSSIISQYIVDGRAN